MRSSKTPNHISAKSHNNSQHVLAIVNCNNNVRGDSEDVLEEFGKTTELPCDIWRDETKSIILASNYPDCILENRNWCILCAGFAYRYREAFGSSFDNKSNIAHDSFARTLLKFCEAHETNQESPSLEDRVGKCLKRCSGHFSVYIVFKGVKGGDPPQFWAWNDPFGFMPVYYSHHESCCILSSHWDCLVPSIPSLQLDWDIVAEYIILGTTVGGGGDDAGCGITFDRTLIQGIKNFGPGCSCSLRLMPLCDDLQLHPTRYIECYGACEYSLPQKDMTRKWNTELPSNGKRPDTHIRGVKVANNSKKPAPYSPPTSASDLHGDMCNLLFQFIMDCVQEAQGYATQAALTGGGDTRLILACLLMLKHHHTATQANTPDVNPIIFQTHSKQPTDWYIARHLALMFELKHRRIHPISTTTNGHRKFRTKAEVALSNLHDQTPMRRRQKNLSVLFQRDNNRSTAVEYTLHGRFGTEFLGCMCFYKSPLDIRTMENLEKFRPKAMALFQAVFSSSSPSVIHNPMDTLHHRFRQLERDQMAYDNTKRKVDPASRNHVTFDAAYAFQLQLYTRASLSDIYKGLRGGSWFSIPIAQFTRNAITPFLDNRLLQCMMCSVPAHAKHEPYELYGKLYQSGAVPDILLKVPSNNKLLCHHSVIPHALKLPEAETHPYLPKFVTKNNHEKPQSEQELLGQNFHPAFWNTAIAIFKKAPITMDPGSIAVDSRPDVQAFLDRVGGDADVACCLSGRLQSFLLWCERRFLVHANN